MTTATLAATVITVTMTRAQLPRFMKVISEEVRPGECEFSLEYLADQAIVRVATRKSSLIQLLQETAAAQGLSLS